MFENIRNLFVPALKQTARRIGLDEVNAGFDAMHAGEVCRSVIMFD